MLGAVVVVDVVLEDVGDVFSFSSDDDPVGTKYNPQQPPYKSNYSVGKLGSDDRVPTGSFII